ncbi:Broad specificity phosphatase PhoE [Candidatus Hydrogenisulfobacillus filiaventi]|uniref:Broad specificity phosphatase PhoE n=1 Tax=Candidatus Hydrogenisulfobacillus filiaventi TaxID=2707344 RepID=A0A6F8ZJ34_9FIRM|nr:histidine phosphatase family protein [Bacillota bacterium]CAB1129691.1 Broad specificity phosphatase PhoE [Candidatus Hydrogenisulfobacillus filiaventi]
MEGDTPGILWVIRHGRPAVEPPPALVDREGFNRYLRRYDVAGLSPAEEERLRRRFRALQADLAVASDLPRAVATARALPPDIPFVVDEAFREIAVGLPDPADVTGVAERCFLQGRWPAEVWWSYIRWAWFRDRGAESRAVSDARAQAAIRRLLTTYQAPRRQLVVIGHAGFLSLLVWTLRHQGRLQGPWLPHPGFGHPTRYLWRPGAG